MNAVSVSLNLIIQFHPEATSERMRGRKGKREVGRAGEKGRHVIIGANDRERTLTSRTRWSEGQGMGMKDERGHDAGTDRTSAHAANSR